jgi:hypothetical protein
MDSTTAGQPKPPHPARARAKRRRKARVFAPVTVANAASPLDLRGALRRRAPVLALYLLLALVVTFPLVLHFSSALPGDGRDAWQNYWDYWWLRMAIGEWRNPYQTSLLYAPYGAPLYLHTLNPFNGLVTLPIQIIFGLTAAYNSVVILSLTLAAFFASLLVGHVSGGRRAGFIGGIIYAFGSYHFAHLLGHANLIASEWLPAYILALIVATEAHGRARLLPALGAFVSLLLLTFCDWQYVLFAGVFTACYGLYHALARRSFAPLAVATTIGGAWALVAAPLLLATARELRDTATDRPSVLGAESFSADLLSFFVPSPLQSWWGAWAERVGGLAVAPAVERGVFLGVVPLLLALCGLGLARRRAAFWGLFASLCFLLALGPVLQIAGHPFGLIPLPYRLLQIIPGVNVSRVPARFALLVTLALAVLAGLGLVGLRARFPRLESGALRFVVTPLLVVALLAEHFAVPYPLTAVEEPAFYRQLAASAEPGAILELPFSMTRSGSLFGQTIHGRPIIGGYLSRPLAYPLLDLPPFADPANTRNDFVPVANTDTGAWSLHLAGVRWIVVLLDDPKLNRAEIDAFLRDYAAPTPLYTDAQMAVYRPKGVGAPGFYLHPDAGWYQPESLADQRRMRWLPRSATVDAWSLDDSPQNGTLHFEAWSFNQPRRLTLSVDGRQVGEWLVAEPKVYTLPVSLTSGEHRIEFRTPDEPERPARTVGGSDDRLISIGVTDLTLRP